MNYARKHDSSKSPRPVCGRTIPMTSQLRKKRPTTRPSFRPRNDVGGSRVDGRGPDGRVRFSSTIAAALIFVVTTVHAEPVKLQWGGQQSTAKKQSTNSNTE